MTNIQVKRRKLPRIAQGDIFRDVECIERVLEDRGIIEVSKVVFPLAVLMTQDCDLEQNAKYKPKNHKPPIDDDKRLFSVLFVPLYNAEHVFQGAHLSALSMNMAPINKKKTPGTSLMQNERPRYHYLEFPHDVPIVPQIADFKHYFSSHINYVEALRAKHFVCRITDLFREDLSQRFAAYLARIGLPELKKAPPSQPPQPSGGVIL
ncbi:hypothetical protein GGD83_003751 [Rhodoblastus sphagnicola]|uniref:hypothetical protein n=1 Tax=Rhodoblastus sphagnicola TaxID=333368 RepID=UPI0011AFED55|nr:hypothetical protein [Rhodoblastus sphagnicola]MBB4199927.1 hypothetical protein [Rhodoblastus sphagnicola]